MNSKTVLTAIIGAIVGLGLAMGTTAFARDTGHMGGGMMGQTIQQNTHGTMHGQNVQQGHRFATTHHANARRYTGDTPCHAGTVAKSGPKAKQRK
jgi:uncharacterized protein YcfJ